MIHHRRGEDGIERWLIHEKRLCATLSDLIDCYIAHGEPVNPEVCLNLFRLLMILHSTNSRFPEKA